MARLSLQDIHILNLFDIREEDWNLSLEAAENPPQFICFDLDQMQEFLDMSEKMDDFSFLIRGSEITMEDRFAGFVYEIVGNDQTLFYASHIRSFGKPYKGEVLS